MNIKHFMIFNPHTNFQIFKDFNKILTLNSKKKNVF